MLIILIAITMVSFGVAVEGHGSYYMSQQASKNTSLAVSSKNVPITMSLKCDGQLNERYSSVDLEFSLRWKEDLIGFYNKLKINKSFREEVKLEHEWDEESTINILFRTHSNREYFKSLSSHDDFLVLDSIGNLSNSKNENNFPIVKKINGKNKYINHITVDLKEFKVVIKYEDAIAV